jgi:hypothetical protein
MKKRISIIMAIAMVLCSSFTAYAENIAGSGQAEIKAHIYSRYNITIPATIDLNSGNYVPVTINDADLENDCSVNVYVTNIDDANSISLTHESGSGSIRCGFVNNALNTNVDTVTPLVSFSANDISQGFATKDFGITYEDYGKAGNYSGIMEYRFECVNN